jgi:acetyl-CoA carboxylase carboxyltransferase component
VGEDESVAAARSTAQFRDRRRRVESQLGGPDRLRKLRLAGKPTARDHIAAICDAGSFREIGTFAGTGADGKAPGAGDGKIAGHGLLDGEAVTVVADDVTVKHATSSAVNARKIERVMHQAREAGNPVVYFGETGGARLPELLRGESFAAEPVYPWLFASDRPPLVTGIVGDSFGASSFVAAVSDAVVMLDGAVMALTSPRVIEVATGARITAEALGGARVNATVVGTVDAVVADYASLYAELRTAARLLDRRRNESHDTGASDADSAPDRIAELVPADPGRAYDMHDVIDALVDAGDRFEFARHRGQSVLTALARIDGRTVGVVGSQPSHAAGAIGPDACDKVIRLTKLCERLRYPIVCLQDTPGFQVGADVEHAGLIGKAMTMLGANTVATVPIVTVVLRKGFGLGFFALFGPSHGADVVLAWPDAQIGFMAPQAAANVLHFDELRGLPAPTRHERLAAFAAALGAESRAIDVAAAMGIDEIIDPATTRDTVRAYLRMLGSRRD